MPPGILAGDDTRADFSVSVPQSEFSEVSHLSKGFAKGFPELFALQLCLASMPY